MSIDTLILQRQVTGTQDSDVADSPGRVSPRILAVKTGDQVDAWEEFNYVLRESLLRSGFRQSEEPLLVTRHVSAVTLAPGIMVWEHEYQERFGGFDLESFRQRMSPELFKAFVRYAGSIPGRPDLNIDEIASIPE